MMFASKRALVTGAASGIGRAIAIRLAANGMHVYCADLNGGGAAETTSRIAGNGDSAEVIVVDIADADSVRSAIDYVGTGRTSSPVPRALDVLVNNAAIVDPTPTSEMGMEQFRALIDVNLLGAVGLTLAAMPLLRESPAARILNVASVQGFLGTRNSLSYATAKGGLIAFTRALAADLADDGVLVNALAPGFVDTPMARFSDGRSEYESDVFTTVYQRHSGIPLRRPGTAEEIAEVAAFLCSPMNSYITGQVIVADGGMTATFP